MWLSVDRESYKNIIGKSERVSGRFVQVRLKLVGKHPNKPMEIDGNDTYKRFYRQVKEYSFFNKEIKAISDKMKDSKDFVDILEYIEFDECISSGGNGGKCTFGC